MYACMYVCMYVCMYGGQRGALTRGGRRVSSTYSWEPGSVSGGGGGGGGGVIDNEQVTEGQVTRDSDSCDLSCSHVN
jgi:hypothetical protein